MRKPNDMKSFLSTQCFTVYKQDLGKAWQSECFSGSLVLQRAARPAEHVLVPALFPPPTVGLECSSGCHSQLQLL